MSPSSRKRCMSERLPASSPPAPGPLGPCSVENRHPDAARPGIQPDRHRQNRPSGSLFLSPLAPLKYKILYQLRGNTKRFDVTASTASDYVPSRLAQVRPYDIP